MLSDLLGHTFNSTEFNRTVHRKSSYSVWGQLSKSNWNYFYVKLNNIFILNWIKWNRSHSFTVSQCCEAWIWCNSRLDGKRRRMWRNREYPLDPGKAMWLFFITQLRPSCKFIQGKWIPLNTIPLALHKPFIWGEISDKLLLTSEAEGCSRSGAGGIPAGPSPPLLGTYFTNTNSTSAIFFTLSLF